MHTTAELFSIIFIGYLSHNLQVPSFRCTFFSILYMIENCLQYNTIALTRHCRPIFTTIKKELATRKRRKQAHKKKMEKI